MNPVGETIMQALLKLQGLGKVDMVNVDYAIGELHSIRTICTYFSVKHGAIRQSE